MIGFRLEDGIMKLKIGDSVYPKKMITYSNKQHMFEDDCGTVVGFETQKREEWWDNQEERILVVVESKRKQLFKATEDFWIKA